MMIQSEMLLRSYIFLKFRSILYIYKNNIINKEDKFMDGRLMPLSVREHVMLHVKNTQSIVTF